MTRTICCFLVLLFAGCAPMSSKRAEVLPAGYGKVILDAGGIETLSFTVVEQVTGKRVANVQGLEVVLPEGTYKFIIKTSLDDPLTLQDVTVIAGQVRPLQVPVGQFLINVSLIGQGDQESQRVESARFTIYTYTFDRTLGKGTVYGTTAQRFIAPVGTYKIGVYIPGSGEQVKVYEVEFGKPYVRNFEFQAGSTE
ncbi:MAG: hypothetical protein HY709_09675 [Candidatus Latescibacteria bacterium]|nr:hypothetical protein [Candidatus Latescibacterota bacterium]